MRLLLFFVAGVVSLLQGLTNLEAAFSVNIVFVVLVAIIALAILYWRRRWVLEPFVGPIRNYRFDLTMSRYVMPF